MNSAARNQLPLRLRGPRPPPLTVNKSSTKIFKKSTTTNLRPIPNRRDPVIVYLRSPKIIHVRPEEFKSFVQRLTGKGSSVAVVAASFSATGMIADHPDEECVSACTYIPS